MQAFAREFPDAAIVHQLNAQIPWKHTCTIIDKVKSPEQRL
jgi:hypothetical protein